MVYAEYAVRPQLHTALKTRTTMYRVLQQADVPLLGLAVAKHLHPTHTVRHVIQLAISVVQSGPRLLIHQQMEALLVCIPSVPYVVQP